MYDITQSRWELVDEFEKLNFSSMNVCNVPDERLILMGENGEILAYRDSDSHFIKEGDVPGGSECYMDAISTMNTGERAYAVGSERHIWRRNGESDWEPIHDSTRTPDMEGKSGQDMGFGTISGFNERDIYVSGYQADTWHYDGEQWFQVEMPTRQTINSVLCADNGNVYLAGDLGTLIKGYGEQWTVIESDVLSDSRLDCLTWFEDHIYISTPSSLLRINKNDKVEPVWDIFPVSSFTVGVVKANEFMLVACGVGTVRMFDGKDWRILAQY